MVRVKEINVCGCNYAGIANCFMPWLLVIMAVIMHQLQICNKFILSL